MKYIGQFIQDFIARFRNDVFLEDVDSGTIASGGNLGLDSNNKIVKAAVPTDTNTQLSNEQVQDIVGAMFSGNTETNITATYQDADGTIDLVSTDTNTNQLTEFTLTGDSGSAQTITHGNTLSITGGGGVNTEAAATDNIRINHNDTSSQASVNNSGSTYIQDVTLDTYGHVTGLTSSAIPTLNQDTTGNANTATNLVASTSTAVQLGTVELGHASDTTIARSASGVATIESNIIQTRNRVIHLEQGTLSDNIATTEHFFPAVTTAESTAFANVVTPLLMPVGGKLLKVHMKANNDFNVSSNEVTFRLYAAGTDDRWNDGDKSLLGTKVITGGAKRDVMIADFNDLTTTGASGTNAFSASDMIGISIQNSQAQGTTHKIVWTFVFELDFNSY